MSSDPTRPDPSPARLAAYLDGHLDAADNARVVAWLADHPAAAEEVEGQRRLLRLWQSNSPPEPGPAAWAASLEGIQARLPAAAPRPWRMPRPLWLAAGAAAAVFAAVLLTRSFQGGFPPKDGDEPLPVIGPGDVTVISIDARDAAGLVVAAPPEQEPILLASQEDVSVMDVKAYRDDDLVPQIGEGEVPLIVAASVAGAAREP